MGASVQGRGARVRRLGDARDTATVTSRGARQVHLDGFDLHANVWVLAHDRAALERLWPPCTVNVYGTYPAYHPPTTVNYYGSSCGNCGGWSTAGVAVGMVAGAAVASANTSAATANAYNAGVTVGSVNTAVATTGAYSAGVAVDRLAPPVVD